MRSAQTMSRSSTAESLKVSLSPSRRRRCPESIMLDGRDPFFVIKETERVEKFCSDGPG